MQLKDEDLKEFIEIWKKEFGEEISIAEARQRARELLELFLIGCQKAPEDPRFERPPTGDLTPPSQPTLF